MFKIKNYIISVFGLGYVGLPLAVEFAKKTKVFAFDIDKSRVSLLKKNIDTNKEVTKEEINKSKNIVFTNKISDLKKCNIHIVAVPTPVNQLNKPDLRIIKFACKNISKILKKEDIVIFESTVFPGLTEEICVPILEKYSDLKFNVDFFCGYSPERINPGDTKRTLKNIVKITSGSNNQTAYTVNQLYKTIIKAGTYLAPSIKIAEAAKVIENAQRDINIAFVNELSIIFDKLNINTNEVMKAAATKWNFLNFKPGLVGGHCIGVDPYYLTYKSKLLNYDPLIISSGRNINDNYYKHIGNKIIKTVRNKFTNKKFNILLLGATFKENCSDFRNSKSIDLYKFLLKNNLKVDLYDPLIDQKKFYKQTNILISKKIKLNFYHSVVILVPHDLFIKMGESKIKEYLKKDGILFDFKNIFNFKEDNLYI